MEVAGQPLLGFEIALVGAGTLCWVIALVRGWIHRWVNAPDRLSPWAISGSDFLLFSLLFVSLFSLAPAAVARILGQDLSRLNPHELLIQGYGTQLAMLLAWALFRLHPSADTPKGDGDALRAFVVGLKTFIFLVPPLMAVIGAWYWILDAGGFDPVPQDVIEIIHEAPGRELALWVLLAVVVAPVTEELVFRGYVFRFFAARMPLLPAGTLSGAVFSVVHFNLLTFVPLLVLGIVLSAVFMKTGRLSASIALHAVFNLNSIIVILLGGG